MRRQIQSFDIQNPDRIMSQMIQDYVNGNLDDTRVLFRATVVAIDNIGSQFESQPPNPKNTIKARIITNSYNANTADEDLPVFWPLFPHISQPIKEKEHVYVLFEDEDRQHGLWIARIPEPLNVDSKNYVPGIKQYVDNPDNELSAINAERIVQHLPVEPSRVDISSEFIVEDVPPFTSRVGDHVIHGSNNTLIVLGRDRATSVDQGQTTSAGTVDIVAGRTTAEDMNSQDDKARVYITMLSDVDTNFGTGQVGRSAQPAAAVVAIADEIRIVARTGAKIIVKHGDLIMEADRISIGNNAQQEAVLGSQLATFLSSLLTNLNTAIVATPSGPGGFSPATIAQFNVLKTQLQEAVSNPFLSRTVKVKA